MVDTQRYLNLFLDGAREQIETLESSLAGLTREDGAPALAATRRAWHTLKGMTATMGYGALAELCHAAEAILAPLAGDAAAPKEALHRLEEATGALATALAALEAGLPVDDPSDLVRRVRATAEGRDIGSDEAGTTSRSVTLPGRVRVACDNLNLLMADVADLGGVARSLSRRLQETDGAAARASTHIADPRLDRLRRVVRRLTGRVTGMRLMPLSLIVSGLERTVANAAAQRRASAHLRVEGADTLLDRATLEVLIEPLVHLLRNAVAHGTEPPARRSARGLGDALQLGLRARLLRGVLHITVTDDGPGVDTEALARRLHLDGPEREALDASGRDLSDLLCRAGISTAERLSNLAGRGVGLEAVREALTRAGGRLRITSRRDHGVTVELTLPQTVTVTPCLLARCGATTYGLPIAAVGATDEGPATALDRRHDGTWGWHGRREDAEALPLELLLAAQHDWTPPPRVSVVRIDVPGRSSFSVVVDSLIGRLDAAVRPLPGTLSNGPWLGTALCGDGTPVAVIDPSRLERARSDTCT